MKVLVINCGSSSLKYQLLNMEDESVLAKGLAERIGIDGKLIHERPGQEKLTFDLDMPCHGAAISWVMDALMHSDHGVIRDKSEIEAIGHRIVHGGETFTKSALITPEVEKAIEDVSELAPLHNPANLTGIRACAQNMPGVPQVAVFDTAFHQTMPEKAYLYALDYALYEKYKIRRYGFHGTSHMYVSQQAAELLGRPIGELRIITCHLGNGASVCAVDGGKSVDTSMGLTPLEGLTMGTRCGDIDPAVVTFVMDKEKLTTQQANDLMNKKSGVLGISGVSSDFRDLGTAAKEGNARAQAALDIYAYNVAGYIGRYAANMKGVDAIVFTAGVGENDISVRENVCAYLGFLGVDIDPDLNAKRGTALDVSKKDARTRVLVIPTNEELVIARDTKEIGGLLCW
ncbi:MAG: acetate kinase [Defluviitaleaceae bacterium]|nr:acetate kinase [Defluviitaleaceae bacterium]MCL2239639.1 acetate kinase [Defluviitaleaceae bacterium]